MAKLSPSSSTASGRTYLTKGRPKGNAGWKPQAKSLALLTEVQAVLAAYAFAITCRQIFYRLVGLSILTKDEKAYGRLLYLLGKSTASRPDRLGRDR